MADRLATHQSRRLTYSEPADHASVTTLGYTRASHLTVGDSGRKAFVDTPSPRGQSCAHVWNCAAASRSRRPRLRHDLDCKSTTSASTTSSTVCFSESPRRLSCATRVFWRLQTGATSARRLGVRSRGTSTRRRLHAQVDCFKVADDPPEVMSFSNSPSTVNPF